MSPEEPKKEIITEVKKEDFFEEVRIKEFKDDYIIKKCLKFCALVLIIVFGTFLAIIFMQEASRNGAFRGEVLSTLKYNLGAIFVAIFGFLGLKIAINTKNNN
jgi:hypothetical protein